MPVKVLRSEQHCCHLANPNMSPLIDLKVYCYQYLSAFFTVVSLASRIIGIKCNCYMYYV